MKSSKHMLFNVAVAMTLVFAVNTVRGDDLLQIVAKEAQDKVTEAKKEVSEARTKRAEADRKAAEAERQFKNADEALKVAQERSRAAQQFARDAEELENLARSAFGRAQSWIPTLNAILGRVRSTFDAAKQKTLDAKAAFDADPSDDDKKKAYEDAKAAEARDKEEFEKATDTLAKAYEDLGKVKEEAEQAQKDLAIAQDAFSKAVSVAAQASRKFLDAEAVDQEARGTAEAAVQNLKTAEEALLVARKMAIVPLRLLALEGNVSTLQARMDTFNLKQVEMRKQMDDAFACLKTDEEQAKKIAMIACSLERTNVALAKQAIECVQICRRTEEQGDDLKKAKEGIAELESRATKIEEILKEVVKKTDLKGRFGLEKRERRVGNCTYIEWVHVPLTNG